MRVFIAVELPQKLKEKVAKIQDKIKESDKVNRIKWVSPDSLHITLKFLGEIEKQRLKDVFEVVEKTSSNFCCFSVNIQGMGIFPESGTPRVLWVGIEEGACELFQIVQKLEKDLFERGFAREKKEWKPHITIGRVKQIINKQLIKNLVGREKNTEGAKVKVEKISVMQSRLTPQGAIYTPLKRFSLQKV